MDFKQIEKYFKVNNTPLFCAIGAFVLAIVMFIVGAVAEASLFYIIGVVLIILAILVVVFGMSGKMSDAEFDRQVKQRVRELDRDAIEHFNLYDTDIKTIAPFQVESYEFSEIVGGNVRRGGDNKYRSSAYTAAIVLFAPTALHIYHRRYTILSGEVDETNTAVIKYIDIADAKIVDSEYVAVKGDKKIAIKTYQLIITKKDNTTVTVPALFDADADNAVSNIKRLADRAEKQAAENA